MIKIISKIFRKIKQKNTSNLYKFEKKGDFFCMQHNGISIYTHDVECINRVFKHIFERDIYNFKSITDNPLIIDAGANIGLGVLYWKQKYPKARIMAFEPSKRAFKSLEKNVRENRLENVVCINKALSDKEGIQYFTTNEIISGSLVTEKNLAVNYEVETTTLTKYLNEDVDFLKIDIEGGEKYIFEDIKNNIGKFNHIFLEYHSFISESQYLSKYLSLFEENNFRYFIEDEYKRKNHFIDKKISLGQDMQLNIWVSKNM